jgi:hypothetical protein
MMRRIAADSGGQFRHVEVDPMMRCAPLLARRRGGRPRRYRRRRRRTNPPHTSPDLGRHRNHGGHDPSETRRSPSGPRHSPVRSGGTSVRAIEGPLAGEPAARLALGKVVWRAGAPASRRATPSAPSPSSSRVRDTRGSVGPTPAVRRRGPAPLPPPPRRPRRRRSTPGSSSPPTSRSPRPRTPNWGLRLPAIDPRTRLVPSLPPIWFDSPPPARSPPRSPPPRPAISPRTGRPTRAAPRASPTPPRSVICTAPLPAHALGDPIDASAVSSAPPSPPGPRGRCSVAQTVLAQIGGAEARAAPATPSRASSRSATSVGAPSGRRSRSAAASPASPARPTSAAGSSSSSRSTRSTPRCCPISPAIALADAALAAGRLGDDRRRRRHPRRSRGATTRITPSVNCRASPLDLSDDPAAREPGAH